MTQPSPNNLILGLSSAQWALVIAGVAIIFALRRLRAVQKQKLKSTLQRTAEPAKSVGGNGDPGPVLNIRDVSVQIQMLLTDVEETARRAAAQVDNRYMKLEVLLAEADAKIKRLEELSKQAEGTAEGAEGLKLAGRLRQSLESRGEERREEKRDERREVMQDNPAYEAVYRLADAGMPAREIAQKLGKQPGEIELILALRASGKR